MFYHKRLLNDNLGLTEVHKTMNWMACIENIKSEMFSLLTKCGMILSYNFDLVKDIMMI